MVAQTHFSLLSSNKHIHSDSVNTFLGTSFSTGSMVNSDTMQHSSSFLNAPFSSDSCTQRFSQQAHQRLQFSCILHHLSQYSFLLYSYHISATVSPSQSSLCSHLPQVWYFPCIKLCVLCLALARAVILLQDTKKPVPHCGEVWRVPSTGSSVLRLFPEEPRSVHKCVTCFSKGTWQNLKHLAEENLFSIGHLSWISPTLGNGKCFLCKVTQEKTDQIFSSVS